LPKNRRRLFLDDDPERAAVFLSKHPDAIWVQTVPECVEKLLEKWDEIHLDHDLGGEAYVDIHREDCGMEIVRWLAREPRRHLRRARFTVHSHNQMAACVMVMQIQSLGFRVEAQPFGVPPPEVELEVDTATGLRRHWNRARALVRRLRGRDPLAGPGEGDEGPVHGQP
jgi:hypothetical protein